MPETQEPEVWDAIVIGAGIGGLSAAAVLARHGRRVRVLEANYLPGGCCSSYWRKGYVFEAGATTLMGFDAGMPLQVLAQALGSDWLALKDELYLEAQVLDPAMTVWVDGQPVQRYADRGCWVAEASAAFGQPQAQAEFWEEAFALSDFVWAASGRTLRFPPRSLADAWATLAAHHPRDYLKLRYAFISTQAVLRRHGLHTNRPFRRFVDEQLLITAQNTAAHTPFLFAAPALTYTNATNVNLGGGMIQLAWALIRYLGRRGGDLRLRRKVTRVVRDGALWCVTDATGATHRARQVLSNLPVWNLPSLTEGKLQRSLQRRAQRLTHYWGAVTLGLAMTDTLPADLPLHHQFILPEGQQLPHTGSRSVFLSLSAPGDALRAPAGERVLALSTHAHQPGQWWQLAQDEAAYEKAKADITETIIALLERTLPGFSRSALRYHTASTPLAWQQWTGRHEGTVGGLPQDLARPIFLWDGALTAEPGFFRCGDTVYPGQGVPGVALGGLIAARRMMAQK